MKTVPRMRLAVITTAMLLATAALNLGGGTRRAKAFTTLAVTNTNDSGSGSLRQAVMNASGGDTIDFNLPLPATITLTSGEISIGQNLTITGPGANLLTISGNSSSPIFSISGKSSGLTISGLTIADGFNQEFGGGIANSGGELIVSSCTFRANVSQSGGGAISNISNVEVTNSAFAGNTAPVAGAIISNGFAIILNSTFSGNAATTAEAGALEFGGSGNVVTNCTIAGNSAAAPSGGIVLGAQSSVDLTNTIIAGNTGGNCITGQGMVQLNSHNLIQDSTCGAMLSGDPELGPLQNNGGQTPTMALLAGSPAIDAGDDSVLGKPALLATDQRGSGFPRKAGSHVDIGAFEVQPPPTPMFDTCLKDNNTGNLLQWNSSTGQYVFTRCSEKVTLSGTGTVSFVGGIHTLTDVKSDRSIHAGFNPGQLTGSATIDLRVAQGVWTMIQINDTNPSAVCKCL